MSAPILNRREFVGVSAAGVAAAQQRPGPGPLGPPARPQPPPIEFCGWDYGRLGHSLSLGEQVALRFRNNQTSPAHVPVRWRLTTYEGAPLTVGEGELQLTAGATGEIPVRLPADLKDGAYLIHYTAAGADPRPEKLFHFDFRRPEPDAALNLTVLALVESIDAKAWVRLMFGSLARYVNVLIDWPAGAGVRVDAVLAASEVMPETDPRLARLRDYLSAGGNMLLFGKPGGAIAPLLPVRLAEGSPFREEPSRLRLGRTGPWRGFRPANGPKHFGLRVTATEGAEVLAQWDDGTPAVVLGKHGKGRVVFAGVGSGQVWQETSALDGGDELGLRLLYWLSGGERAVEAMLTRAGELYSREQRERLAVRDRVLANLPVTPPRDFVVVSRNNCGRFGWLNSEGGLVDNLTANGTVQAPGTRTFVVRGGKPWEFDPRTTYSLAVNGQRQPRIGEVVQNWFAKTLSWRYDNGAVVRSTLSLGSPAILWEGDARQPSLTCSSVTHAAYASASGIRVMSSGETIHSADLAEGWLLLFIAQPEMRDVPVLLVLTRRPESVRLGDGLHLTFGAGGFGALFTSRLWGARRLAPGQTTQWTREVPGDAVAAARRWSQIFLRYPVDCDEIGWMEKETVVLANRFRFRPFTSAWGTPAETLAPLAPVLPLARSAGAPLELPRDAMDLSCPTKLGPLQAVKGETTLVRIPLPPRDHRAIIPADGRMVLREAIDWATGGLHLDSKTHPDPNVRNEGSGDLHEDLAQYDIANTMPFNESPCIDVYKWWYTFNAIQARPAYSPALRAKIDRYYKIRYWETLNFYAHKCLVRQKREPFSGVEYIIHFVWPTQTQFGYRNFNDGNEASSVTASCFTAYARYYGDWTTLRANWNHCRRLHEYLPRVNDWACMSSGALEYWSNAGFDMLNSEPYGNLAFAYAAEQCGRPADALLAKVLGARAMVPCVARLALPGYLESITAPGDPWRGFQGFYHFMEDGIMAAPNKMGAIGLLDTSKGTSHELALAYKTWAGERILAEQKAIEETTARGSGRISFPDLTQRLFLGWNLAGLLEKAKAGIAQRRERPVTWNSATDIYDLALLCVGDIPLFLSEWAPAEYVSGRCDEKATEVELLFLSREAAAFTVRLYSQKEVNEVSLNSVPLRNGWRYDAASGWLTVTVRGSGEQRLSVRLGKPAAPLHPYFPAGD